LNENEVITSSYDGAKESLLLTNLATGVERPFLTTAGSIRFPVALSGGGGVLYVEFAERRPYSMGGYTWDEADLWRCDDRGGHAEQLTFGKYRRMFLTNHCTHGNTTYLTAQGSTGATDLYTVNISKTGKPPVRITKDGYTTSASVSSDGESLLTVELTGATWGWDVFETDLASRNRRQLTHLCTRILQAQYDERGGVLFVVDAGSGAGGELWRLERGADKPELVVGLNIKR